MAHRIITRLVLTGTQVVGRAFVEAYKQASSASAKASATAAQREASGGLNLKEARKILGIDDGALDLAAAQKKFDYLFDANSKEKSGSFYLQSKVYRAMERIKHEMQDTTPLETSTKAAAENTAKDAVDASTKGQGGGSAPSS